jgi:hypothetical protein
MRIYLTGASTYGYLLTNWGQFILLLGYKFALFINKTISQDFKDWKYQVRLHGVYQERVVRILWSAVFSQKYTFSLFNLLIYILIITNITKPTGIFISIFNNTIIFTYNSDFL